MDVDAVVIPGGYAADKIRLRHAMVDLVRDAVEAGKPVAAIDHGPSVLINAKALSGRMITCGPAGDAENAGAGNPAAATPKTGTKNRRQDGKAITIFRRDG